MRQAVFRDAFTAALLAALLALPLLGIHLEDTVAGGQLTLHGVRVLLVAVLVFGGRLLWAMLPTRLAKAPKAEIVLKETFWHYPLLFAVLAAAPLVGGQWVNALGFVFIYAILGLGLNIVVGLAGLLDLGFVAFYAIGAYTYALLAQHYELSFWVCLPLAAMLAATVAALLGLPILRLRGDYFAIVTLAFAEIIQIILTNWESLTGGSNGIASIARPTLFGLEFKRIAREGHATVHEAFGVPFNPLYQQFFLYYLGLFLLALVLLFSLRIRRLPLGRAWEAMRENEVATRALGINLTTLRLSAYSLSAAIAAVAGCLFAVKQGFISPSSFNFMETAMILAILVLGGLGNPKGIIIAAAVLVLLPEVTRGIADYRMLLFGLTMVLIMVWKPQGLGGQHRTPTVRLEGTA
jgi:branched-chain amino acid transport system permease protein